MFRPGLTSSQMEKVSATNSKLVCLEPKCQYTCGAQKRASRGPAQRERQAQRNIGRGRKADKPTGKHAEVPPREHAGRNTETRGVVTESWELSQDLKKKKTAADVTAHQYLWHAVTSEVAVRAFRYEASTLKCMSDPTSMKWLQFQNACEFFLSNIRNYCNKYEHFWYKNIKLFLKVLITLNKPYSYKTTKFWISIFSKV